MGANETPSTNPNEIEIIGLGVVKKMDTTKFTDAFKKAITGVDSDKSHDAEYREQSIEEHNLHRSVTVGGYFTIIRHTFAGAGEFDNIKVIMEKLTALGLRPMSHDKIGSRGIKINAGAFNKLK